MGKKIEIYKGDCLELMKDIPDKSIDMVLCDLPYGTTACKWDSVIPFEPLWEHYNRVIKDNGAVVLFGSQPFTTALIASNIDMFKYEWIWQKNTSAGFIHAKNRPLKRHENIMVFSRGSMGHESLLGEKRLKYNPQDLIAKTTIRNNGVSGTTIGARPSHKDNLISEWTNYPTTILNYKNDKGLHPTQKPVDLLEYLIKTYTNEGETVLDNCMGSGSTGVACINSNRKFIGMELDDGYFEIAKNRIEEALKGEHYEHY